METLPSDLWGVVFSFIPAHRYAARCVCKAWRTFLGKEPVKITARTLLETLGAGGDPTWLKEVIACWDKGRAGNLLEEAAAVGNLEGMKLAKDWGAVPSWASNAALRTIVTRFDRDAAGWATFRINTALALASAGGHFEAMELAKEWGASNVDRALWFAAGDGQLEAMSVLRTWGASDFDRALCYATEDGQFEAMSVLRTWGATDLDQALVNAAAAGQLGAMSVLRTWGATDLNRALRGAAVKGQLEAMELLVHGTDWGATDFDWALGGAAREGQLKAIELLEKWRAT